MSRRLIVYCDLETRSFLNLLLCGAARYADPTRTRILCMAYAIGDGEVQIWFEGEPFPDDLARALADGAFVSGFNFIGFDRLVWNSVGVERYGWPPLPLDRCIDTQHQALAYGLPARLETLGKALDLAVQKDREGHALMLRICNEELGGVRQPEPSPEERTRLGAYCITDVASERAAARKLPDAQPGERQVELLTARINDQGFRVDLPLARALHALCEAERRELGVRVKALTRQKVQALTRVADLKAWLAEHGVAIGKEDSLDRNAVDRILAEPDLDPTAREVLEMRRSFARTSTKKLPVIIAMAGPDNGDQRVRGAIRYHGASTGRFSSLGVQIHNFPRQTWPDQEEAVRTALRGELDLVRLVYGDPLAFAAKLLRATVIAEEGWWLVNADLSQIEARITAWLADQWDVLRVYEEGGDTYVNAAMQIYRCTAELVDGTRRQIGKVAELALGFAGGVGAFRSMAGAYGVVVAEPEAKRIVWAWRDARPQTVAMWEGIERAAWWATANPGHQVACCRGRVVYWHNGTDLMCRLPSGRWIVYPEARFATETVELPSGETERRRVLRSSYALGAVWASQRLWRGILVENVVQATARDVLVPALARVEEGRGMRPVLHVHDSVLAEVRDPSLAGLIEELVVQPPAWAEGLPIAAKVSAARRWS